MRNVVRASAFSLSLMAVAACGDDDPLPAPSDGGASDGALPAVDAGGLDSGLVDAGALQKVTLRFQGVVGTQPLACGQVYDQVGSSKSRVTVRDFRFFVEDVRLRATDGREVPLQLDEGLPYQSQGVALIDFTTNEAGCQGGEGTNFVITGSVPAGAYRGLSFSTAVPQALNHAPPESNPPVLRNAVQAHWGWVPGYRFVMAGLSPAAAHTQDGGVGDAGVGDAGSQGDAGVDGGSLGDGGVHDGGVADAGHGGAGDAGGGMHHGGAAGVSEVHIGSTGCSGTPAQILDGGLPSCAKRNRNRVFLSDFTTDQVVVADLGAAFANVDLRVGGVCHSAGPSCAAPFAAFGVDFESGSALSTQQVFRVSAADAGR